MAQLTLRIQADWVKRAKALLPKLAKQFPSVNVTDVMRMALSRGLDALEKETK